MVLWIGALGFVMVYLLRGGGIEPEPGRGRWWVVGRCISYISSASLNTSTRWFDNLGKGRPPDARRK